MLIPCCSDRISFLALLRDEETAQYVARDASRHGIAQQQCHQLQRAAQNARDKTVYFNLWRGEER